ncbi:ATP5I [Cordylochernes scorpioides]|uniref:ATP synthase F(0) complex subunit e, mitochondrial n=1 Tax=Cordylochernes scorpioides TaxID=51811 RepID=A0ABY6LLH8_9ARAC|nr:ATP5I [Cordylochernes scorpioides]
MEYKRCSFCIPGLGALTGYYQPGQLNPARWTALIAGVVYGYKKYYRLRDLEIEVRKKEAEEKKLQDAIKLREQNRKTRQEMLNIAGEVGVPIPPNFDEIYKPE